MTELVFAHGLSFAGLYDRDGLVRLDRVSVAHPSETDVALHDRLMAARADPGALEREAESDLLVDLAPHLEDFIGELFGIDAEVRALQARRALFGQASVCSAPGGQGGQGGRRRRVRRAEPRLAGWKQRYAEHVAGWLADEAGNNEALATAQLYAAWATLSEEGRRKHRRGVLFKAPHRLDMQHLVPVETVVRDGVTMLRRSEQEWHRREGFALTDRGTDLTGALDQANYCIWCHNQGKDSCATGLREKDGAFKKTVFGVTLAAARSRRRSPK